MFESCLEIRRQFSEYVDGMCSRQALRSIRYHLRQCGACELELERYELLRADLRELRRPQVPAAVGVRLNVALSRVQHARLLVDLRDSLRVRFENVLRPLLLPASGAVLAGLLCFGLTLDWLILPPVRPDALLITPARIESLAPLDFNTGRDGVVLVTRVNADGQVVDYRVLSGESAELKPQLDRLMYFSVFRPATMLGRPTESELVLSLRRITVRASAAAPHEEPGKPSGAPAERSHI